ncbi:metabotropic glutamate receptor 2 [Trichonephila clavipes]|nr:metabotropic glutamate receptor 2 [Trichonephila clavipes]
MFCNCEEEGERKLRSGTPLGHQSLPPTNLGQIDEEMVPPDACERCDLPPNRFIWIGSDGWGAKERIVANREQFAEGTVTILPKRYPIQEFDDYFKSLRPSSNSRNPWFKEFWENQFDCVFKKARSAKMRKQCTAIGVSSRPKLIGFVRGKAFLHVLRRRPIGCPDSANVPYNARCDGYDLTRLFF